MHKIIFSIALLFTLNACVSTKKYDSLLSEKVKLDASNQTNEAKLKDCEESLSETKSQYVELAAKNNTLSEELTDTKAALDRSQKIYDDLEVANSRLKDNYKQLLESSTKKSDQLSKNLSQKEQALLDLEQSLLKSQKSIDTLTSNLEARERKVEELERVLAQKDSAVQKLRNIVNDALLSFKDNDLTVEVRNGKVYVSLASKLLFSSGSIEVDEKGKEALTQLANVLQHQPEINIMVEGHTDTRSISKTSKYMRDNWDLSVMRATSILRILTDNGVNPEQIIAAGRGEFSPVDEAKTEEALQKNRRTEIILTPKLDELFEILN